MKQFHDVPKLPSQVKNMPTTFQLDIIKGIYHVLAEEFGKKVAFILLLKAIFWDMLFNKPKWDPEIFTFKNKAEEKHYKNKFKELSIFIILFENIERKYGQEKAQETSAKIAVPASVPYLAKTFKSIPNLTDIDQFRQLMANYLGDGMGFAWTEKVSEDKTEVQYNFTQCVYIEILRAYGLVSAAASCCYCDHIIFDMRCQSFILNGITARGLVMIFATMYFVFANLMMKKKISQDMEIQKELILRLKL